MQPVELLFADTETKLTFKDLDPLNWEEEANAIRKEHLHHINTGSKSFKDIPRVGVAAGILANGQPKSTKVSQAAIVSAIAGSLAANLSEVIMLVKDCYANPEDILTILSKRLTSLVSKIVAGAAITGAFEKVAGFMKKVVKLILTKLCSLKLDAFIGFSMEVFEERLNKELPLPLVEAFEGSVEISSNMEKESAQAGIAEIKSFENILKRALTIFASAAIAPAISSHFMMVVVSITISVFATEAAALACRPNESFSVVGKEEEWIYPINNLEIPNKLTCPITKELLIDPVISPAGHFYSKHAIKEWLHESGTDPITREASALSLFVHNAKLDDLVKKFADYEGCIRQLA
ncbi:hypothetical protein HK100_012654 [Physocladia obscura]|uniref:U-box domain-containing protein n=1 Tax=Physocladia obscura TaxID=109957 RepID=A0AAD5T216_9FUNG|nr:hypothetical protein HK100_012654 [Physocladia obscura]